MLILLRNSNAVTLRAANSANNTIENVFGTHLDFIESYT